MERAGGYKARVRDKVGVQFYELCMTNPAFRLEPKAIGTAYSWLNQLSERISANDGKPVTWTHTNLKDRFKPYKQSYTKFRNALVRLDLLHYTDHKAPSFWGPGKCRAYSITERCKKLICDTELNYLYQLLTNKAARRRNQKNISKRKVMKCVHDYRDPALDYIHRTLIHLDMDDAAVFDQLKKDEGKVTRDSLLSSVHQLNQLKEKRFSDLKRNETDGRVWNTLVALKKQYRRFLRCGDLPYRATIDVRACHASLLGVLIWDVWDSIASKSNSVSSNTTSLLFHYTGVKGDIPCAGSDRNDDLASWRKRFSKTINPLELMDECSRWSDLFTGEEDPRADLQTRLNLGTIAEVKGAINVWLNGGKKRKGIKKLREWFSTEFPAMEEVWKCIRRSETTNMISEEYETKLFLSPDLFEKADRLGVKLSYEYDGVGVFASKDLDDDALKTVLSDLCQLIVGLGERMFEVRLRLKTELI